ncbi:MAG: EVE domain-containing protein [Alphaproteobacteria bacterium]|nr:EVE domain-containing protein [Alphaproteobacteria bacterium]
MAYWLVKSEPDTWSWHQQVAKNIEMWDGVRNHQAAKYLREMAVGDLCFFYHSNIGKEIVGIVRVVRTAYTDPTDDKRKFVAVDMQAHQALNKPVTLAQLKQDPYFHDMGLIKQSRLSVMPVAQGHWDKIIALSQTVLSSGVQ